MASFLNIERVNALPETLKPNTMYVVKATEAGLAEMYFSNSDGTEARHLLNKSEVQSMINASIANFTNIQVVADIAARNALVTSDPNRNLLVLVLDATGDATVSRGAALYVFVDTNNTWAKVSEFESLDVVLEWSAIQGRPTSSVADIDDAVARKHSHANKATLDKVGEDIDGNLTFGGKYPMAPIAKADW